ncbi:MAG: precorrin-3B C(17)-methyltransferase [Clostridium sp.]|uniref:precorrin-3B C(17)-methyltransferase n=1 Tax=Clostridium sp. DSM 8431 TaxID=1761781 RepID=UPI0008EA77AC|nr:precorrin-3B C(17)-methyltransferase [Clostridium sp. DSM 8431]MCR4942981.1 precorrin-3B C(17)-methyltransferase [Clostridium sp.]SFU46620.1 precorrin-3B C17-methyltransferase [Clostridium sp. DSM 8431]
MNKVYCVGIGPGDYESMTLKAIKALENSDVIVGYTVYVDLVEDHFKGKKFLTTPMKKEVDRCILAFEEAKKGNNVSLICSGDAGIYGLAEIMIEVSKNYEGIEVEVIPGITAANSGAAVLGAPLIHDFAVISLSDLLTPLEKIEKRIECAAASDFVIVLYNPSSKKRHDYLQKACDIVLKYAEKDRPCGLVKNIGREGEESRVLTLEELRDTKVDMFTTVFIGNSMSKIEGDRLVTPRGYKNV